MVTRAAHGHEDDEPPRRKATLFCPSCDHESPVEGDWRLRSCGDRTAYVCPVCDTTITVRPRTGNAPVLTERRGARLVRAWGSFLTTPLEVWRASLDGVSSGDATAADS